MAKRCRENLSYYSHLFVVFSLVVCFCGSVLSDNGGEKEYVSAVGDPGMRRDNLRVAIESWNQCNEVGEEAFTGSPRAADCFDIYQTCTRFHPEGT